MADAPKLLKPYMGFSRAAGSEEGACLVFAQTAKEARKLAHSTISGWMDSDWLDTAVRLVKDWPSASKQANAEKLAAGVAHVIESPETCPRCKMWGAEQNEDGSCGWCYDPEEEQHG